MICSSLKNVHTNFFSTPFRFRVGTDPVRDRRTDRQTIPQCNLLRRPHKKIIHNESPVQIHITQSYRLIFMSTLLPKLYVKTKILLNVNFLDFSLFSGYIDSNVILMHLFIFRKIPIFVTTFSFQGICALCYFLFSLKSHSIINLGFILGHTTSTYGYLLASFIRTQYVVFYVSFLIDDCSAIDCAIVLL